MLHQSEISLYTETQVANDDICPFNYWKVCKKKRIKKAK